jgi:hypothetical protein
MATGTDKWKAVSVKGKVEVIRQMENGKQKAEVCWEFGLYKLYDPKD